MSVAWIWAGKAAAFKNDAEYVAARDFTFGDISLKAGEPIDKTTMSVRRLRQLHDRRYVALKDRWERYQSERSTVASVDDSDIDTATETKTADSDKPSLESQPPQNGEPVTATIKHKGFAKWSVMVGEDEIATGLTKEEATAQAEDLNK